MSYVELLFAFLNLGVLVFLLGYVFYSKFLPQIIKEIHDRKAQRISFEKMREEFFEKLALVGQERENRESLYQNISNKVVQWKTVEMERQEFLKKEKERLLLALNKRLHRQQERAAMQRVRARIVPQALAEARLELYDFFQTDRAGVAYIDEIVKVLDKRTKELYGRRM